MLGFGKKKTSPDTQIPYEVYETVREPANRRRQWLIRLVAALAVVTLLIIGGTALVRSLRDSGDETGNTAESTTQQPSGQDAQQGTTPRPAPTPAVPAPTPTTPQPSAGELPTAGQPAVNDSTIRKPE